MCTERGDDKSIARVMHKPLCFTSVLLCLQVIFGDGGYRFKGQQSNLQKNKKRTGFRYQFDNLNYALTNLLT